MNREIKFRGKRKSDGKWIYGLLCLDNNKGDLTYIIQNTTLDSFTAVNNNLTAEVDFETVGQYTGLKDKNGVEIYEKDIIETEDLLMGVVKYGSEETDYPGSWIIHTKRSFSLISDYVEEQGQYTTVIGNVYENKELFKNE